jgi:hypothetical protein
MPEQTNTRSIIKCGAVVGDLAKIDANTDGASSLAAIRIGDDELTVTVKNHTKIAGTMNAHDLLCLIADLIDGRDAACEMPLPLCPECREEFSPE